MQKTVLFVAIVSSFSLGAYFLWVNIASNAASESAPQSNPILSDLEKKVADNPSNILEIIAETRTLVAQTKNPIELARARIKLDRAITAFYKAHLRDIAEKLAIKNGLARYQAAYLASSTNDLKAEPSARYRNKLETELLQSDAIDPNSEAFKSYVYVAGSAKGTEIPPDGSVSKETMRLILASEKGITANTGAILSSEALRSVFGSIGLKPWSSADLRTMRKMLLTEGLGWQTNFTKAYITASIDFAGKQTKRIYLRDTLKHVKQAESLSCEANSIMDLFNYYRDRSGTGRIAEAAVFQQMPVNDAPPKLVEENGKTIRIWSDPDKVFVGKVRGVQSININKLTGYGIHPKGALPIISTELGTYGYSSKIDTLNEFNIIWSLYESNPVLFWYVLSDDPKHGFSKIDWRTPEGLPRTGYVGEHTGIIVGAELSKNGDLLKVGYYEGTHENIIWESFDTLAKKASYFDGAVFTTKKGV